jgi:hypothetical protein
MPGGPDCLVIEVTTPVADTTVNDLDWRAPLLAYLLDEVFPANKTEARKIDRRTETYVAVDGELYKRRTSVVGMLMKCIPTHHVKELLLEIHASI